MARANENIGFIVFEAGHGTIGKIEFEAFLGRGSVWGVGDSPPNVYNSNLAFTTAPQVAVTIQAGIDGINGSWAQKHGSHYKYEFIPFNRSGPASRFRAKAR